MEGRLSRGSGDRPVGVGAGVLHGGVGGSRGATSLSAGVIDQSGQAHMRGLVTSRPLFVAGLAF